MVHRDIATLFVTVLKQREVRYPQQAWFGVIDQPEPAGQLFAQRPEGIIHRFVLPVRDQEQHVARLCAECFAHRRRLFRREKLFIGGSLFAGSEARPCKAFRTIGLYPFAEFVDLLAAQGIRLAFQINAAHAAARRKCAREHAELRPFQDLAQVGQFHRKAQIRLVGTETVHRLMPGHAAQRSRNLDIQNFLIDVFDKSLRDGHHVILRNKGHLEVDLRKLRLPVGAQILVAETAGHLHVAVETGKHQNLLIKLRGLRQREKAAREHAGGHQVVACAFRCGLNEIRRLNLEETVFVKIVARCLDNTVPFDDVFLHLRPSQVQIAVFQAEILFDVGLILNGKRRGFALCENAQLRDIDFNIAGRKIRIFRRALPHCAARRQNKLRTRGKRLLKNFTVGFVPERKLNNSRAVTQIDKDQLAQVALPLHPAADGHFPAAVRRAQLPAVIGPFQSYH